jgi:hypothetical protein
MRSIIIVVLLLGYTNSKSQDIIVQKIKLRNTSYKENISEIPKIKDVKNQKNPAVEKINSQILEYFWINSFKQNEIEEFKWYDVKYSHEIKQNILCLSIEGESGYGPYPSYLDDEVYFDLKTGEMLSMPIIPFQALFSLSGYVDFIQKYWLEGVKKEFKGVEKCAEMEPYCSYYDIEIDSANKKKVYISLIFDCFPRVVQACSPSFSKSIELTTISQYLNDVGRYMLLESNYFSKSPLEKFLENRKLNSKLTENIFVFGKIDKKYPFSLAINIANNGIVSGFYFYDSKLQKISLSGIKQNDKITLTEKIENIETGYFEFKYWSNRDKSLKDEFALYDGTEKLTYITGLWTNKEKTKTFPILINEIKTHRYY